MRERRIAEVGGGPRVARIDDAALVARVGAVAAEFREMLKQGGPRARRLLQRVLNGRRVPCVPFREAGRRGYRFREEEIPYAGVLSNDIGGPKRDSNPCLVTVAFSPFFPIIFASFGCRRRLGD